MAKISRYSIVERIGVGGMSDVYKAYDEVLGRNVVLKVLKKEAVSDDTRRQRFLQEARAASALNHPNILTVYEIGNDGDVYFIATEFVEGETLRQKLQAGKLEIGVAVRIALQLAEALSVAHRAGIAHRDIKPENIMIRNDGYVKVLDFGLAKLFDADSAAGSLTVVRPRSGFRTNNRIPLGTIRYMSPEQIQCLPVDHRCDFFAFGIVLYEMFTGKHPFSGMRAVDIAYEIVGIDPPLEVFSGALNPVYPIVAKCLEKNPAARYQDAEMLLKDLRQLAAMLEDVEQLDRQDAGSGRRRLAKPNILAVSFENLNCDLEYDWLRLMLAELLLVRLASNARLQVVASDYVADVLEQLRKRGEPVDRPLVFEVARKCKADFCLTGSFLVLQKLFLFNVHLNEVGTGRSICSLSIKRSSPRELFSAVDEIAERVERELKVALEATLDVASLVTDSVDALKAFESGLRLYRAKSFEAAAESFTKALQYDGGFALSYFYLARIERILGKRAGAINGALERLGQLNERERLLVLLDSAIAEADYLLEFRLAEEIVKQYPCEKLGYLSLAAAFRRRGEVERAYLLVQKALALDPGLLLSLNKYEAVGVLEYYFNTGRYETALELAKQACGTDSLRMLQVASIAAYNARDMELARRYLDRACEIGTSVFNQILRARLALAADEYVAATEILKQLLASELEPAEHRICVLDLADGYREQGKLSAWLETLNAEHDLFSDSGIFCPHFWRGMYFEQLGQLGDALREYEAAVRTVEADAEASLWAIVHFARMLAVFGRWEEAIKLASRLDLFEQGQYGFKAEHLLMYVRGCIEFHKGNHQQALKLLDRSIWSVQECSLQVRTVVQVLRQMRKFDEALALLARIEPYGMISEVGRFITRSQVCLETAKTYEALGDKVQALECYRRCIKLWAAADDDFLGKSEAEAGLALLTRN
ncbi:MAG: protein kinase [Acidobacteriota bacterium]|nr:protein kinase [Blastocatellia bacterium]MDW8413789.1 protein kinase [Acidobacteriota bacterium]